MGTWGAEGRFRTRLGRQEGYLGRWRPFSHQVGPTGGVPGAVEAISAPGGADRRGTWGAGGRFRTRLGRREEYLGR